MGIAPLARRNVATLSDGEMQKVMIAKALAQQTPVILLDEPTAFLDFPSKVDVMASLSRLGANQQKVIVLSTHDVELALRTSASLYVFGDTLEETDPQRVRKMVERLLKDSKHVIG